MSFQSTLRRTERPYSDCRFSGGKEYFNPRSDERSDSKWLFDFDEDNEISIHAPTNGATRSRTQRQTRPIYFNPRSDERSDVDAIPCHDVISVFQSTLRRTERHCILDPYCLELIISIHAPTNGATR